VIVEDAVHDRVVLGGIAGPVDARAQRDRVALEVLEVVRQPRQRVPLDPRGCLAQRLPAGDRGRGSVALLAHPPDGLIMPVNPRVVGDEARRGAGMIGGHAQG